MGKELIIKLTDLQTQYKIQQIIGGSALGMLVSLPIGILSGVTLGSLYEYITIGELKFSTPVSNRGLLISNGTVVVCTISGAIVGGYLGNKYARTIKFV